MTLDEHMCLKTLLMNVRDELDDLARRDEHLQRYVADVEECLAILRRRSVVRALTAGVEGADAANACPQD
jgi:hypothetical protein